METITRAGPRHGDESAREHAERLDRISEESAGGIETAANEYPTKYGAGDMAAILLLVVEATEKIQAIGDILTGRDTHPLFEERGVIDPARFYVGMISERLLIELFGLERYLETVENMTP